MVTRRRAGAVDPPDGEERVALAAEVDGQPVDGVEGVVMDEPVNLQVQATFTPEQIEADRKNKISRTDAQAFTGSMVVTVVVWILRLRGVDLNPLPGQDDIPAEVGGAWGAIVTVLVGRWMNRR